jgi:hypothetical protein
MTRKTHLVGTWPAESAPQAMEIAFTKVGDHLPRMSDGETGDRAKWVVQTIDWMRANPDVEITVDVPYESYTKIPKFKLRDGHKLDPDNIELGYHREFQKSYRAFKVLRERFGKPDVKFQVGLPMPLDLAVYVFGMADAIANPELTEAFREASVREVTAIQKEAGDDVVFQIETVVALVRIAMTMDADKPETAKLMADGFKEVVSAAPKGTHFGAHLCLGDFKHKSMVTMVDATPAILLANALAKDFPKSQTLDYIHVPFAAADKPASMEASWYEPLKDLDIPDDVRFVAGFLHESASTEDQRTLLEIIERNAGREVDVAAACGLSRRATPEDAWDAMEKAAVLIET